MAPIKFEEQLKSKLEKRSLSPSTAGWSKLSERLDADKKKSKLPVFWWLSIAAAMVVMLAVSVQYFNTNNTEEVLPQLVNEEILKEQLKDKQPKINAQKSIKLANEAEITESQKRNTSIINKPKIGDYKAIKKKINKTQITENTNFKKQNSVQKTIKKVNSKLEIETFKSINKNAVASTLNKIKTETTSVTDKEIDALLKAANKEIFKNKLQESTKTVDANTLLISVEDDMGQSFRSKVFEALKENYKTIKTAVVERNN